MARTIRRILVAVRDLDRIPGAHLRKAAALSRAAGARVELFHAMDEQPSFSQHRGLTEEMVSQLRREGIERALRRLTAFSRSPALRGLQVTCHAVWDFPSHEAIVRRVLQTKSDLVIAGSHMRSLTSRWLLQNADWELIRQCPCPLLLAKSRRDYRKPAILVAVDPFHTHAKPANLDRHLLDWGAGIARLLRGSVHVIHCYMPLLNVMPLPVGAAIPMVVPPEAEDAHRELVARSFDRLAESAGVPPPARHLRSGFVRTEVNAVVAELGAGIVVMGAVSRSGLRRAFIGSTAEDLLDNLLCDVLVIKPRGFKSNVTRRSSLTARRRGA